MNTDCKRLSKNAREIFVKLGRFYPADPWNKPRWLKVGRIHDNGWYDLRKSTDRNRLIEKTERALGYSVKIAASIHKKKYGSMRGFTTACFSKMMQHQAELLLILEDLDFQIETQDLIDEICD
jgi:hypothetical protein